MERPRGRAGGNHGPGLPGIGQSTTPHNPLEAYSSGQQHDVPLIAGSTRNEGTLYLADETDLSLGKYKSFLQARFADRTAQALAMFPATNITESIANLPDK